MKIRADFLPTAIIAGFLFLPSLVHADDRGQIKRGHDVAVRICAACHAVERGPSRSPYRAAPPFEQIANTRAMTALALRVALQSSHPVMPNVRLKESERTDVIAYLLSLKRLSLGDVNPVGR